MPHKNNDKDTAFISQINYTAKTQKLIDAIRSTVFHSIRAENSVERKNGLEWNEELTHLSFMYIDKENINLAELSDEEREFYTDKITQDIVDDFSIHQEDNKDALKARNRKLSNKLSKSRNKLKKFGYPYNKLANISKRKVTDEDLNEVIKLAHEDQEKNPMREHHFKQRLEQLHTYKNLSESIFDKPDMKKTAIQEFVLKFPSLENGKLAPEKYMNYSADFYKEYLPDFKILAQFFHGDETYINEKGIEVGHHAHTFVSAKSEKDGSYSLLRQEKEAVMKYLEKNREDYPEIDDETFEEMKRPIYKNSKKNSSIEEQLHNSKKQGLKEAYGVIKQDMFFDFFGEKLKQDGIEIAKVIPENEQERFAKFIMRKDARKRKSDRDFNFANVQAESNKNLIKSQENKLKKNNILLDTQDDYIDDVAKKVFTTYEEYNSEFKDEIYQKMDEFNELKDEVVNHKNYDQHKQDNLFRNIIDKVESVLDKDDSFLKSIHKKAYVASEFYRDIFDASKEFYFEKFEQITGEKHRYDTELKDDLVNEFQTPNLDEIKDKMDKEIEEKQEQEELEEQKKDEEKVEDFGDRFDEFGKYIFQDDSDDLPDFESSDISNQDLIDELNNNQNSGVNIMKKYNEKRDRKAARKLNR